MINFIYGFLTALVLTGFIEIITTTTPEKAIENLRSWKALIKRNKNDK